MKINLSQNVIQTVAELQDESVIFLCIEDVENFLIDNVDYDVSDNEKKLKISSQLIDHLRFLRRLRNLLKKICENEQ